MDALDRFAQLMEQHPPPDRQAAADSDAHFRARVSWMLGLYDQFEAEGLRLQEARETFEEGERQVVVARTLRIAFYDGIELHRRDPAAADRLLQDLSADAPSDSASEGGPPESSA